MTGVEFQRLEKTRRNPRNKPDFFWKEILENNRYDNFLFIIFKFHFFNVYKIFFTNINNINVEKTPMYVKTKINEICASVIEIKLKIISKLIF